jgi:hypothetical protein
MLKDDTPRDSYQSIKEYYDTFLLKKPHVTIVESYVTMGDNERWCQDNGIYQVTMSKMGESFQARYSFFYVREDNIDDDDSEWKSINHV